MAMKNEQSVDVIEIETVEGRLEFGFWGWLTGEAGRVWHWFTHACSFSNGITCKF